MTQTKKRFLTEGITDVLFRAEVVVAVILAIIALIALYKGEQLIISSEMTDIAEIKPERIPLQRQIERDMEAMEVPEYLLPPEPEVIVVNLDDVYYLAQVMWAEEEEFINLLPTKPEKTERVFKLAGSAVLHRLDVQYKDATSIQDVIFEEGQYETRTKNNVREGQEVPDIIYQWAEELLIDGPLGPRGMIYQSQEIQGDEIYDHIGNQYFCIETKYN